MIGGTMAPRSCNFNRSDPVSIEDPVVMLSDRLNKARKEMDTWPNYPAGHPDPAGLERTIDECQTSLPRQRSRSSEGKIRKLREMILLADGAPFEESLKELGESLIADERAD